MSFVATENKSTQEETGGVQVGLLQGKPGSDGHWKHRYDPGSPSGEHLSFLPWSSSISERFGRKQALWDYSVSVLAHWVGRYRKFQQVDWQRVSRLVFVCSGNICRSPFAEAVATKLGMNATSFGLTADEGKPADPTASKIALQSGLSLSAHRARTRDSILMNEADLVLAMEPRQAWELIQMTQRRNSQVTLLGLWHEPMRPNIGDPYGLSEAYFRNCFRFMKTATENVVQLAKGAARG